MSRKINHTVRGKLDIVKLRYDNFVVNKNRNVRIWLPFSYSEEAEPFNVIYCFDGQNLFDEKTAAFHKEWQIDETIEKYSSSIRPSIVVGIDCSTNRDDEYTPSFSSLACGKVGYKAEDTIKFLSEVVMPYVEEHYNVSCVREGRSILGSSLGGLMALYGAIELRDLFSTVYAYSIGFVQYSVIGNIKENIVNKVAKIFTTEEYRNRFKLILCTGGNDELEKAINKDVVLFYRYLIQYGYSKKLIILQKDMRFNHDECQWAFFFRQAYLKNNIN